MPFVGQDTTINGRKAKLVALTGKTEVFQFVDGLEPDATVIARTGPGLGHEAFVEILAVLRSCGVLKSRFDPPGLEWDHVVGGTGADRPRDTFSMRNGTTPVTFTITDSN